MLDVKLHMSFKQSIKTFKESKSKIEETRGTASKECCDGELRDQEFVVQTKEGGTAIAINNV